MSGARVPRPRTLGADSTISMSPSATLPMSYSYQASMGGAASLRALGTQRARASQSVTESDARAVLVPAAAAAAASQVVDIPGDVSPVFDPPEVCSLSSRFSPLT
jgi:hypothetical protein